MTCLTAKEKSRKHFPVLHHQLICGFKKLLTEELFQQRFLAVTVKSKHDTSEKQKERKKHLSVNAKSLKNH